MRRAALVAALSLPAVLPARDGAPPPRVSGRGVFILKSPGVCAGCAEAVYAMLAAAGIPSRVIGPELLKSSVGPRDMVVIGGSEPDEFGELTVKRDLVRAGAFGWLKRHIAGGGRYLGICAGAYLTEKWIDEEAGESGLDVFPGNVDNYDKDKSTKFVRLRWLAPAGERWVYFQDGPAFYPRARAGVSVFGTFAQDGTVAAAVFPYGKGRAAVLSPHLEADEGWGQEEGLTDPDGVDFDLGLQVFRALLD
ncbi:hypothetical protein EPO15_13660 [bacterium]|nr:MAG: hypothetical protein EPO15_13660 [bacterium]